MRGKATKRDYLMDNKEKYDGYTKEQLAGLKPEVLKERK